MSDSLTVTVPGMHCRHCEMSVREEVADVPGVEEVIVDLESKLVTVLGRDFSDEQVRAAIEEAGYEAA